MVKTQTIREKANAYYRLMRVHRAASEHLQHTKEKMVVLLRTVNNYRIFNDEVESLMRKDSAFKVKINVEPKKDLLDLL